MSITVKDFLLPRTWMADTTTESSLFDPDRKEKIDSHSNIQQIPPGVQPFYTAGMPGPGTAFDPKPLHLSSLISFSL